MLTPYFQCQIFGRDPKCCQQIWGKCKYFLSWYCYCMKWKNSRPTSKFEAEIPCVEILVSPGSSFLSALCYFSGRALWTSLTSQTQPYSSRKHTGKPGQKVVNQTVIQSSSGLWADLNPNHIWKTVFVKSNWAFLGFSRPGTFNFPGWWSNRWSGHSKSFDCCLFNI